MGRLQFIFAEKTCHLPPNQKFKYGGNFEPVSVKTALEPMLLKTVLEPA